MHRSVNVRSTPIEIQCAAPEIQQLTHYWHRQRGMFRRFPLMDDIAPRDLAPFINDICILDYTARPRSLVYRLVGSGMVERLGVDPTGGSPRTLQPYAFQRIAERNFDEALRHETPIAHEITVTVDGELMALQQLILPLSMTGVEIDFLLTYCKALSWDAELFGRTVFEPESIQ